MKIIKRKSITFALAICLTMLGFVALLVTQVSQPTVSHAHEFSGIEVTERDSASIFETIAAIEEELQEKGTSVLDVLYNQRDFYLDEFNNALPDEQPVVLAKLSTINKAIESFEGTAFALPNNSNFGKDISNNVSTYSFGVSPNCTCDWQNYLLNSPCGNCLIWSSYFDAVVAIAAGFSVRGWLLASDLVWHNLSNTVVNSDYTPTSNLVNRVAQSPQILNEVAQQSELTKAQNQASPGRLSGLFATTIEGDIYNSLGSFYYCKSFAGNGKINISILDRYDWHNVGSGSTGAIFDTMVAAEAYGVLTPFYTKIDIIVSGIASLSWQYSGVGVIVTGTPNNTSQVDLSVDFHDLRVRQKVLPTVKVTSIGNSAFANCTQLSQISIPESVTSIGSRAFANTTKLTKITYSSYYPAWIDNTVFSGVDRSKIQLTIPMDTMQDYLNAGWTGFLIRGGR